MERERESDWESPIPRGLAQSGTATLLGEKWRERESDWESPTHGLSQSGTAALLGEMEREGI